MNTINPTFFNDKKKFEEWMKIQGKELIEHLKILSIKEIEK